MDGGEVDGEMHWGSIFSRLQCWVQSSGYLPGGEEPLVLILNGEVV